MILLFSLWSFDNIIKIVLDLVLYRGILPKDRLCDLILRKKLIVVLLKVNRREVWVPTIENFENFPLNFLEAQFEG